MLKLGGPGPVVGREEKKRVREVRVNVVNVVMLVLGAGCFTRFTVGALPYTGPPDPTQLGIVENLSTYES